MPDNLTCLRVNSLIIKGSAPKSLHFFKGWGKMTLSSVCQQNSVDLTLTKERLAKRHIIMEDRYNLTPREIADIILAK